MGRERALVTLVVPLVLALASFLGRPGPRFDPVNDDDDNDALLVLLLVLASFLSQPGPRFV